MIINVLDIETTGLSQDEGHRIIELCSIFYNEKGEKQGQFLKRFNPKRPIDPKAQAVHHISNLDLAEEPVWDEHEAARVNKLCSLSNVIVCHNTAFDLPFVYKEIMRVGGEPDWKAELFCTMEKGRQTTPMGNNPNLGALCFALGVDYNPDAAHAADYDVEVTAQCFFRGIETGLYTPESFAA